MPAVLIRQLDALARIMERTTTEDGTAGAAGSGGHDRAAERATVDEASDRADISRAYQAVLTAHADVIAAGARVNRRQADQASRRSSR